MKYSASSGSEIEIELRARRQGQLKRTIKLYDVNLLYAVNVESNSGEPGRLEKAVAAAADGLVEPAAELALVYAERIDESTHVPLGLADALDRLRLAAQLADESSTDERAADVNSKAFRKVAAALSAVTVAGDLGPKLLAALDALMLTPRARAKVKAVTTNARPASPLDELRSRRAARQRHATTVDPTAT